MSGHTHIHTDRTTTVTLAAHARRGLINAGSQIDAGSVARTRVHTYVRDDFRPRAFYRSTATAQTAHARLFVAVAALARHAARCLPSFTLLINLTLDAGLV